MKLLNECTLFGHRLLATNDLDPLYVALVKMRSLGQPQLLKFLVAYLCFYHAGVAAKIASGNFFKLMQQAQDEKWPRASERRHFRGDNSQNAIDFLHGSKNGSIDRTSKHFFGVDEDMNYEQVMNRVQSYPGFGPWAAFKAADLRERVLKIPTDFSDCALSIYKEPLKGSGLVYFGDDTHFEMTESICKPVIKDVVNELLHRFKDVPAPPSYDRAINVQEVETMLCKFKSHRKGHYVVGNDICEIKHNLTDKFWCMLATMIDASMPYEV